MKERRFRDCVNTHLYVQLWVNHELSKLNNVSYRLHTFNNSSLLVFKSNAILVQANVTPLQPLYFTLQLGPDGRRWTSRCCLTR